MKSAADNAGAAPVLVIGYGNELRGDDAAGPRLAAAVAGLGLPNVRVLARHQLTPELCEEISHARAVIFADAAVGTPATETGVAPLHPSPDSQLQPHVSDPRSLLGLAQALFGRCPPAWMVTVPARNLGLGEPLSAEASSGMQRALRQIQELIRTLQ
jgi:hydrogenase maturation protease